MKQYGTENEDQQQYTENRKGKIGGNNDQKCQNSSQIRTLRMRVQKPRSSG